MSSSIEESLPELDHKPKIAFQTWIILPESGLGLTKDDREEADTVLKGILKPRPLTSDKKRDGQLKTEKRVVFIEPEIIEFEKESTRRDLEDMHCHCSCGDGSIILFSLIKLMIIFLSISLVICILHFIWVDQSGVFVLVFILLFIAIIFFVRTLQISRDYIKDNAAIADEIV